MIRLHMSPKQRTPGVVSMTQTLRPAPGGMAPKDSLDFQLQSVYNHHNDSFCSKNQMFYQKKTVSEELRKYEQLKQDMLEKEREKDGVVWVDPERRA
ncbi:hypothetical protein EYF80_006837 [Liparis tanakae]|uniref:Uncharacterized protein n=1 Tax=Liparis tanakae TaxID=230148 RepID=A0A4Z2IY10_9TELE|nr:hypothetical protein EYF80_006837 [Liparis tanakae]